MLFLPLFFPVFVFLFVVFYQVLLPVSILLQRLKTNYFLQIIFSSFFAFIPLFPSNPLFFYFSIKDLPLFFYTFWTFCRAFLPMKVSNHTLISCD